MFEVVNLGESDTLLLPRLVALIEEVIGDEPEVDVLPEQPGDVGLTYADIS